MKALVLLNAAAGTLASSTVQAEADQIRETFAHFDVQADVRIADTPTLQAAARQALTSDVDIVVAGGGDGTINAIASQLVGTGKPLGILPLGTMNHLAKELNLPTDLPAAVAAIVHGTPTDFNIGQVNDSYFLSFSAIGLYSEIIKHRDAQRRARRRSKWPAMVLSLFRVFRRFPLFRVRLRLNGTPLRRLTPFVFVTLSDYQRRLFNVEELACPGRDALSLYVGKPRKRTEILWLIIRSLLTSPNPRRDLEAICTHQLEVNTYRRHVRVAIDGEVIDLPNPLQYRLRRAALRMILPSQPNS